VYEAVKTHHLGASEPEFNYLGSAEHLSELPVEISIDGVVICGEEVEKPDRQPLLGIQVTSVTADQAGDIILGDRIVLARLHARLTFAELGAADPEKFQDATAQE
jgi:hypothetical protein